MATREELKRYLSDFADGGIALAFSGGVDSSLLLAVLKELHDEKPFPLLALFMYSPFLRVREREEARALADKAGVALDILTCDPLTLPQVKGNAPDRCYWCKRHIFSSFWTRAKEKGIRTLIDGTNADDLKVYRPGLKALKELGVRSPLAELGIAKADVRRFAAEMGLACATKPSTPCMATRFEYGTYLTEELVQKAAQGEDLIRRLLPAARDVRLRVQGGLARIEVPKALLTDAAARHAELASGLKALGFTYVTLDLEGFRSGSMDTFTTKEDNNEQT